MGEVYRARDPRLGREVAIKILPERLATDDGARRRFEREARALATLSHPNVLTLFDFGTDEGISYAVMELLEGETLRQRIGRSPLEIGEALEIAIAIAEGLAAAHRKGVIHRDLKPENVFLTSDGVTKILDFGLARLEITAPADGTASTLAVPLKTESGVILGTVYYMAPEQVRGLPIDARCDLFSFGCLLYEMVIGARAFPGNTIAETMAAILRDSPAELAPWSTTLSPRLKQLIKRCLEKDPDDRFPTSDELLTALRDAADLTRLRPPRNPARRPQARPGNPTDSGLDRRGLSTPEVTQPLAPPPPEPDDEEAPPTRDAPAPAGGDESTWSRRAEWGPNLAGLAAVALAVAVLAYQVQSPVLILVGAVALLVLSYPIFITLEPPVRFTPEQAVHHYYDALSHLVPHYRRMWLLLSNAGRTSDVYTSYQGFRYYWRSRLAQLRGGRTERLNFLAFRIEDFRSEKPAGKTAVDAEFTVKVYERFTRDDEPVDSIHVETSLVKGPDQMWYLDDGTLPGDPF